MDNAITDNRVSTNNRTEGRWKKENETFPILDARRRRRNELFFTLMLRREVGNVFRAAEINGETWRIIKASSCIFYYLFIDTFISKINCLAPVTGSGMKGKRMGKL